MIWWNGKSSDDFGIIVEHYPNLYIPEQKTNFYTVGGLSGDVVRQKFELRNYTRAYNIYFRSDVKNLSQAARRVAEWLYSKPSYLYDLHDIHNGYGRLEDSYELGVYRDAVFVGGFEIENTLNRFGRVTIEFNCRPQKFLTAGERWYDLTNATEENPVFVQRLSPYPCHPLVLLDVDGTVSIEDEAYNGLYLYDATGIELLDTEKGAIISSYWEKEQELPYTTNGSMVWACNGGNLYLHTEEEEYWDYESDEVGETVIRSVRIMPRWYVV